VRSIAGFISVQRRQNVRGVSYYRAREPTPACPAYPGVKCVSVQVAIFDGQTVLPLSQARRSRVKPFEQRQLHEHRHHPPGIKNAITVTICPKFKIPNQKVTLK
jgi:hypothetical protein